MFTFIAKIVGRWLHWRLWICLPGIQSGKRCGGRQYALVPRADGATRSLIEKPYTTVSAS